MKIWLPIIINLIIASILFIGAIKGKKKGFIYEIVKLFTVCGLGVGIYFLSPVLVNLIAKIGFIQTLITQDILTLPILKSLVILILFTTTYGIVSLIFSLIRKSGNKIFVTNNAKTVKVKGLNREETRRLRKEQRQVLKAQKKQTKQLRLSNMSKKNKIFGVVFGIINAVVIGFVVTLPLKPIFTQIANSQPTIEEVVKGYEYTPYGQLDKVTNIVDRIIGE